MLRVRELLQVLWLCMYFVCVVPATAGGGGVGGAAAVVAAFRGVCVGL